MDTYATTHQRRSSAESHKQEISTRSTHLNLHGDADAGPQFREMVRCLEKILTEGLSHGFFRCSIAGEIGKNNRRVLVIEAGMSHRFTIPSDELPS
jgi:hypothetical protein